MAKDAQYEVMFILRPDLEDEQHEGLLAGLREAVGNKGGEVVKVDNWGKRKLAYEIKKFNEGHYYVLQINGPHEIVPELEHFFRVNDAVIRFLMVREDER